MTKWHAPWSRCREREGRTFCLYWVLPTRQCRPCDASPMRGSQSAGGAAPQKRLAAKAPPLLSPLHGRGQLLGVPVEAGPGDATRRPRSRSLPGGVYSGSLDREGVGDRRSAILHPSHKPSQRGRGHSRGKRF